MLRTVVLDSRDDALPLARLGAYSALGLYLTSPNPYNPTQHTTTKLLRQAIKSQTANMSTLTAYNRPLLLSRASSRIWRLKGPSLSIGEQR